MREVLLNDIAEIIAGQSPPSESYNKSGEGTPFFQGMADYGEKYPVIRNWCIKPTKISQPNDILISVRAPVGPVNINNVEACIGRGLSAIRAKSSHYYEYIYYFLRANIRQISNLGVGSTFTAITQKDLGNVKISIPDTLADEVKIATVLNKAEALIKQRTESIGLLNAFLRSTFLKMFGDPVRNEKSWERKPISQYTESIVPGRDKPKSFSGSIPWFTTENLIDKGFLRKTRNTSGLTESEIGEVRAKLVPAGSVIMTCVGDLGVLSINIEPCIVNQQLHTYQCHSDTNNIYLMYCLSFMKSFMYKMASTTTVPYMNKTICNSIPIIHPPFELQKQFAEIVERVEMLKDQFNNNLSDLENLYGSLNQRAFKGEIDLSDVKIDESLLSIQTQPVSEQTEALPQEIKNALEVAARISKQFEKVTDLTKAATKFTKHFEAWDRINKAIANIPQLPGTLLQAQENMLRIQKAFSAVTTVSKPKSQGKITWDRVSSEQFANWIKESFTGFHFTSEMLINFLTEEHVTFPDYYSSEELKKNPKANDADDFKSFIFAALNNRNPFLRLEQVFYNGEMDNINLTLRPEDFELIKAKSKAERTGVYLQIIE